MEALSPPSPFIPVPKAIAEIVLIWLLYADMYPSMFSPPIPYTALLYIDRYT